MKALKIIGVAWIALGLVACKNGNTSYSLLGDEVAGLLESTLDNKIDVVWIIDNSGSMQSSQQNLALNFPSFINKFTSKSYDFQLGTNTSDAYLAESPLWDAYYGMNPTPSYYYGQSQSQKGRFRDGMGSNHSGFFVINPATPDLHDVFITNAMLGTSGRGDERSFDSMQQTLVSPHNSGFVRQGGYLAVILVTDEDDFSNDTTTAYETYVGQLTPTTSYVSFLDALTGSSASNRRYSVNTISVPDQACLNSIYNGAQKIGTRVRELATLTGGMNASICGDFADELADIASTIVNASLTFSLGNKKPIPSTIVVRINGQVITDWSYDAATNTIRFINGYAPPQGSSFLVTFDPESLTF